MLYGPKMRYSESARQTEYIRMIFVDFYRVSFFSKNLPVLPFSVEWKNERYLNFVLTMRM